MATVKDLDPEFILELLDHRAERRLGNLTKVGGPPEVAELIQSLDILELLYIHGWRDIVIIERTLFSSQLSKESLPLLHNIIEGEALCIGLCSLPHLATEVFILNKRPQACSEGLLIPWLHKKAILTLRDNITWPAGASIRDKGKAHRLRLNEDQAKTLKSGSHREDGRGEVMLLDIISEGTKLKLILKTILLHLLQDASIGITLTNNTELPVGIVLCYQRPNINKLQ